MSGYVRVAAWATSTLTAVATTEDGYGDYSIDILRVDEHGAQDGGWSLTIPLHAVDFDRLDDVLADAGYRRVEEWALIPTGSAAAVERR